MTTLLPRASFIVEFVVTLRTQTNHEEIEMSDPTVDPRLPTALELFHQYQPRFQEVDLVPIGFNSHWFLFELARNGDQLQHLGKYQPTLSLRDAGFDFSFTYSSKSNLGIIPQLTRIIADEISARIIAGRKFSILPHPLHPIRSLELVHRYVINVVGEPIPGFYTGADGDFMCTWVDFIPKDTPEWQQIRAALKYEEAQKVAAEGAIAIGKEIEAKDWFQKLLPPTNS